MDAQLIRTPAPRAVFKSVVIVPPHHLPAPSAAPLAPWAGWAKPAFDAALAAGLLVLAAPVVLLAMGLIRLTSRGPAVYTQSRVGYGGRVFTILKLRTMYRDAEAATGPRWSRPGDPRITPLGRILRALHIDELPQLLNVLRGEMSLVGPRPERPEIVAGLRKAIPGYDRRLAVRPGITGFAQIHLPPDTTVRSVRRKLGYDLIYVRRRGLGFDLTLLALTGLKVLGLRRLYRRA